MKFPVITDVNNISHSEKNSCVPNYELTVSVTTIRETIDEKTGQVKTNTIVGTEHNRCIGAMNSLDTTLMVNNKSGHLNKIQRQKGGKVKQPTSTETSSVTSTSSKSSDTNSVDSKSSDYKNDQGHINEKNVYKLMDLYFKQKNIIFSHLYNSFDKLLDEDIRTFLEKTNNTFFENITKDRIYKYGFKFENIGIKPPYIDIDDEIMFPQDARIKQLTYCSKLTATITQIQEVIDIATGEVKVNIVGNPERDYPVANIPIMVKSKYCSLNIKKGSNYSECEYDPGGYFIVKGSEKVVISLDSMVHNYPFISVKKDATNVTYKVQIYSKSYKTENLQITNITLKKDHSLMIKIMKIGEVPLLMLMKVLGVETDRDIVNLCVYDKDDHDMLNVMKSLIDNSRFIFTKGKNQKQAPTKLLHKNDIIDFLTSKLKVSKNYTESNIEIKKEQKRIHLYQILETHLLPHVHGTLMEKAYYLGYVINRLLHCFLGRIQPDDRDSYLNKRIELPGDLIFNLFKQYFKRLLIDCRDFFKKRNPDDINPLNVINQIKPGVIEQGLVQALSTGNWGNKKGVAQMLERTSYPKATSSLRRIKAPTENASTNKLTAPRHLHTSSIGPICFIETPEGHNCGLVKSLSLIGNVTVNRVKLIDTIKNKVKPKLINILDVPLADLGKYTRVFVNGEPIGLTDKPRLLYSKLKQKKYTGEFDNTVGIFHDIRNEIECYDLKINCDSGRIYHPVLRIEDNKFMLDQEMIDSISTRSVDSSSGKITTWNNFLSKFPGVIEYIDTDEKANSMLAMEYHEVRDMKRRMIESAKLISKLKPEDLTGMVVNRYDTNFTYLKFTHCELHPSFLIGNVVANVPFLECNQGPRNIYQFSQAKQAMGLYASNYRDRLDISYILYHPQTPLTTTRLMRYIATDKLPFGENAIVAIACYTGYNQEDSIIANRSALDRGLYMAMSVKKFTAVIRKNQATSQDDIFIKPNPSQVSGRRLASYDKLNEQGYAPEETVLQKGDIFIGQVSPIQPTGDSNILFKDNSQYHQSTVPATVDKVYTGIYDNDGYEMRKVRLRMERKPNIGDKFCCYDGYHEVLTSDGWIKIGSLKSHHKVATLVDGNSLVYQYPTAIHNYDYDGRMYQVQTPDIELCVTPNHRMYVKHLHLNTSQKTWKVELAEDINSDVVLYQKTIQYFEPSIDKVRECKELNVNGEINSFDDVTTFGLTNVEESIRKFDLVMWCKLFGLMYSDIYFDIDISRLVYKVTSPIRFGLYVELCSKLGITLTIIDCDDDYKYVCIPDNDINSYMKSLVFDGNLPRWTLLLTSSYARMLVDTMFLDKNNMLRDLPLSEEAIELIQTVCIHAGFACDLNIEKHSDTLPSYSDLKFNFTIELKVDTSHYSAQGSWVNYCGPVYCCTVPGDGIIMVRRNGKIVWCGQSRHAQKGICGLQLRASDMMFTASGICPDLVINPNAIPSRMTMGQLVECLIGKVASLEGHEVDGNPFSYFDLNDISERLKKLGYNEFGDEEMYSGFTGQKLTHKIFIGPTYYQRLKHMVADKMHSRARGPQTILTHQAPEGRARDGGLRFGEMERDCMIAYGISKFLKERLLENADMYHCHVCNICGLFAQRLMKKGDDSKPSKNDLYFCKACKNYNDVTMVRVPYAFKLTLQELTSMNIAPRIRTKRNPHD